MLIALVLVFVVLGIMQYFLPKPQTPPQDKAQQQQVQQKQPVAPAAPAASTPAPPKSPAAAAKLPVKTAPEETESVLENDFYRITI